MTLSSLTPAAQTDAACAKLKSRPRIATRALRGLRSATAVAPIDCTNFSTAVTIADVAETTAEVS
jgi:hypothetical protein